MEMLYAINGFRSDGLKPSDRILWSWNI